MGFGFLGSAIGKIITEANGETLASSRPFVVAHAVLRADLSGYNTGEFDIDNVGTPPQQEAKVSAVFVAATTNKKFSFNTFIPTLVAGGIYTFNFFKTVPSIGNLRGWSFTSSAVLTPATRKHQFTFARPEFIKCVSYTDNSGSGSKSATSNPITGVLNINLAQFPNAEIFSIEQSFVNTINFIPNAKLRQLDFRNTVGLSVFNGKVPPVTEVVSLNETSFTNLNFLSEATGLKSLMLGQYATFPGLGGGNSLLAGVINLSHLTALQELAIPIHNAVTNWILPDHTNWLHFEIYNLNTTASGNFNTIYLNNVLASPGLRIFLFPNNVKVYAKDIGNSEVSSSLIYWYSYQNSWTGNIAITSPRPNLKEFKTGNNTARTGTQQNSHTTVDVSGLTAATTIDISGSNVSTLTLPNNTFITTFYAQDNLLDIIFPFGINFHPRTIGIHNNNMSTANVDATITNIYNNKSQFVVTAKSLNIAGTNGFATGKYQAPAGYVQGSSDGTPANVQEMVYVLVNHYNWTITVNQEPLNDAAIWIDFSDITTYTLTGDVLATLVNKGTLAGSFTINGSPTVTEDKALLHDLNTEWITLTKTFSRPFTLFAVWQVIGPPTSNSYLWGTSNANRDEFRAVEFSGFKSSYFGLGMANTGSYYDGAIKNAFCMQQVSGDHNIYAKTTLVSKAGVGVPSGPAFTFISFFTGRSGFTESSGTFKVWELALYTSSLSQSEILDKQQRIASKHKL